MISGLANEVDDYYGLTSLKPVQSKKSRKMKRTQLSNEKKSNHSQKSFSNSRDSHLSSLKSKRSTNNNTSVLKNQQSSTYRNSLLGTNQNSLPSCTEIHRINNSSTRKNKLQINTGVVGIKMDNFSPTTILSHPSKVLFVNQSTSGKKGSKSKKQKSILYVEYNNFMTEFNNNKIQNKANVSNEKNQEIHKQKNKNSSKNQKQVSSKKNIRPQEIENQYFIGMKKQSLSPVFINSQKVIQTLKTKDSHIVDTPKKNDSTVDNLALSSVMGKLLQSPRILVSSPKMQKIEPNDLPEKHQPKAKVSIQNIAAFKDKNTFSQSNNVKIKSKDPELTSFKKYNTQKQLQKQINFNKIASQKNIETIQNLINPYSLRRDQNLLTNYQKKKIISPVQNLSKQNYKSSQNNNYQGALSDKKDKRSILKTQQNQNFSAVSQSILSQSSSINGKKLINQISSNGSKPKVLLKKSQSKIKLSDCKKNVIKNEGQSESDQKYYKPRISVHQLLKNSQNQSQVQKVNLDQKPSKFNKNSSKLSQSRQTVKNEKSQIKHIEEYKTDYYTPNPHSNKQFQSPIKISRQNNDSYIESDQESNFSQLQKFDIQSEVSDASDINDQKSLKSGKNKFLSSSRLKRQEIIRKSVLRSSRNSEKSMKSNVSKKISLNPKKSSQYQINFEQHKKSNQEIKSDNSKNTLSQKQIENLSSSQSNESISADSLNEASIVKQINKNQKLPVQSVQNAAKSYTVISKHSSVHPTQYKNQLIVQNIQSQIQPFQPSKLKDRNLQNQIKHNYGPSLGQKDNEFGKQSLKSSDLNHSNLRLQIPQPKDLTESNFSSKTISAMKRSGLRKSIKNSIHHSGVHSQASMLISKHPKSNLLARSGKDLKPLTVPNPKIEDFLAYIDEYQIVIGFLYLYVENTLAFYCKENQQKVAPETEQFLSKIKNQRLDKYEAKYERLSFLVMKKYFYEKNRLIKCLRGLQSNVFKLTGLEVPNDVLKKFLTHSQTKQKLKQIQLQARQLFKQLDVKFRSLRSKQDYKKDKLIKIQAPYDNFSRDIVSNLVEQLNQLTAEIDELEIQTGSSNPSIPLKRSKHFQSLTSVIAQEIYTSQQRGIQVMEIVFLISQLQSQKVKKVELVNISNIDFQVYYEKYIDKLLQTYEFFEALKYPSDESTQKKAK